ncbi:MAG: efflux RND transporter periplasmic adaptor subunit [Bacteroidales bacterium]
MFYTKPLAAIIVLLTLSSCAETKSSEESIRKVKCTEIEVVDNNYIEANFPGKIAASKDVNLGFRVAGIVEEFLVDEGAFVRKGDVIALMDNRDYKIQLDATQAEYDGIKSEAERVIALYKEESISENNYDKAVNGLKQITAKLEAHKNALEDTRLKAPFDGYLQKHLFDIGEAVSAGMPVVSMVSSSAPEVIVNIPATNYMMREKYISATASVDIFPDKFFNLKLKSITPKGNLNQLYTTTFSVKATDGATLAPGMTIMVKMRYQGDKEQQLLIPFSSVVDNKGDNYIWILSENGTVAQRAVKVIEIKRDGTAIVTGDIKAKEMVITAGVKSLKEGMRVEALEPISETNIGGVL